MGLDIYLYKCDDRSVVERAEAACKEVTEPLWEKLPDLRVDQAGYDSGIKRIEEARAKFGCDKWGDYTGPGDDYIVVPDWTAALVKVDAALASVKPDDEKYYVVQLHWQIHVDAAVASPREAVQKFIEERDKHDPTKSDFVFFENAHGYFDLEGTKLVAALHAKQEGFLPSAAYLVCEREGAEEDYYLQTLKITKALIEYVLAQPDKDKYYFHWSG